jgi:16S rRNA processing protein RimM
MGVIGRPHGVRGLVHVTSYAADPASLAARPLQDDLGRTWHLAWRGEGIAALTDATGRPLADRDEAARLTNRRLLVDRADLPEPEPDEFYLADLLGLEALTPDGSSLGRITATHDYGAGVSLEIARPDANPLLVPFTRAAVPDIDLAAGRLTILLPDEIEVQGDLTPSAAAAAP